MHGLGKLWTIALPLMSRVAPAMSVDVKEKRTTKSK